MTENMLLNKQFGFELFITVNRLGFTSWMKHVGQ